MFIIKLYCFIDNMVQMVIRLKRATSFHYLNELKHCKTQIVLLLFYANCAEKNDINDKSCNKVLSQYSFFWLKKL